MRQAVEQRGRHLGIAKDTGPFREGEIGRDNQTGLLIKPTHQMKQQGPTVLAEREIAQLIK